MKNILITGITGQDGIFLTNLILNKSKNTKVIGTSRFSGNESYIKKLKYLKTKNLDNLLVIKTNLNDTYSTDSLISSFRPNKIFNLSGPSSVYDSLKDSNNKTQIINIFNNLVESVLKHSPNSKFFQASSSEMFGSLNDPFLDEQSNFNPNSPYAEAKLANHEKVMELSKNGLKFYSGIMFNHESEFRSPNYLIMKIINSAYSIKKKEKEKLVLGSLDYIRDWTYAKDSVIAMDLIMERGLSSNYVIGSGVGHSIKDVVSYVFKKFDLNWENHIVINTELLRKGDPKKVIANSDKLKNEFNWVTNYNLYELLDICIFYFLTSRN